MTKIQRPQSFELILSKDEMGVFLEFREWLNKNFPSKDEIEKWQSPDWETRWHASKIWQKKLCEGQWMGVSWPKEYGGRGISHVAEFLIGEELSKRGAPYSGNWIALAAIGQSLIALGTQEQKTKYLPGIARGEDSWCLGVTEPKAGTHVMSTETQAVDQGDHFLVNGKKIWTTHSPYASRCLLLTRTDPHRGHEFGLTTLVVDLDSPGVRVTPLRQLQGERNYGEILFENVKVPKTNVVGKVNGGWAVQVTTWLAESLPPWDIPHRLDLRQLVQLAVREEISAEDIEAQRLAEIVTDAEAVRLLSMKALRAERPGHFLRGKTPLIKVAFTETTQEITTAGLDWCPDEERALWSGCPQKWLYKHISARSNTIARAPSEIHRNFIAHFELELPK